MLQVLVYNKPPATLDPNSFVDSFTFAFAITDARKVQLNLSRFGGVLQASFESSFVEELKDIEEDNKLIVINFNGERVWAGVATEKQEVFSEDSIKSVSVSCQGLWHIWSRVKITKTYRAMTVEDIARDVLAIVNEESGWKFLDSIASNSQIVLRYEANNTPADEIIRFLAQVAGTGAVSIAGENTSWNYGIKPDLSFFFAPNDSADIKKTFVIGKDIQQIAVKTETQDIINSVKVRVGKQEGGNAQVFVFEDEDSIESFGKRTAVLDLSDVFFFEDAKIYAEAFLAWKAKKRQVADFSIVSDRVFFPEGVFQFLLPKQKVQLVPSSVQASLEQDLLVLQVSLTRDSTRLSTGFKNLLHAIENAGDLRDSLVTQSTKVEMNREFEKVRVKRGASIQNFISGFIQEVDPTDPNFPCKTLSITQGILQMDPNSAEDASYDTVVPIDITTKNYEIRVGGVLHGQSFALSALRKTYELRYPPNFTWQANATEGIEGERGLLVRIRDITGSGHCGESPPVFVTFDPIIELSRNRYYAVTANVTLFAPEPTMPSPTPDLSSIVGPFFVITAWLDLFDKNMNPEGGVIFDRANKFSLDQNFTQLPYPRKFTFRAFLHGNLLDPKVFSGRLNLEFKTYWLGRTFATKELVIATKVDHFPSTLAVIDNVVVKSFPYAQNLDPGIVSIKNILYANPNSAFFSNFLSQDPEIRDNQGVSAEDRSKVLSTEGGRLKGGLGFMVLTQAEENAMVQKLLSSPATSEEKAKVAGMVWFNVDAKGGQGALSFFNAKGNIVRL